MQLMPPYELPPRKPNGKSRRYADGIGPERFTLIDMFGIVTGACLFFFLLKVTGLPSVRHAMISLADVCLGILIFAGSISASGPIVVGFQILRSRTFRLPPGERVWCLLGALDVFAVISIGFIRAHHGIGGYLLMMLMWGLPTALLSLMLYVVVNGGASSRTWGSKCGFALAVCHAVPTVALLFLD